MPQLNPSPWFTIMLLSWTIFLTILPPKIMAHTFPNELASQSTQTLKTNPWAWPWY
uniref:ATP synthase complex subunit 8 n=1 Tax=Chelonodontops patoca TaxID=300230 RepID=B7FEB7_CHEPT|nr:ATP synthase F0 subunit 8 [Chelonodontops patoca]BAG85591.1 ATPase subunit 8 [Chelonodontops patoca]